MKNNNWNNASGYSNVGGCGWKHMFNKTKREECEDRWYEASPKSLEAKANLTLAEATMAKVSNVTPDRWGPLAVGGVVIASLLGIAAMVILIKKAKAKKA